MPTPLPFLLLLALAPAQEPTITYTRGARFVDEILAEVSQQAGTKLLISPQLKGELLLVSVKDCPLEELRSKVARATNAEWEKDPDGWRLIRSNRLIQEQDREHYRIVASRYAEGIKKLKERLAKQGLFDAAKASDLGQRIRAMIEDAKERKGQPGSYRAQEDVGREGPMGRLTDALACLLDPNALATLETPGKVVFSSAPTRMQRPLPGGWRPLVDRYLREAALLREKLPALTSDEYPQGLSGSLWSMVHKPKLKDPVPDKLLVEASTHEFGSGLSIRVLLANSAGKVIESGYSNVPVEEIMGPEPAVPEKDPSGEKPIEFSAHSSAVVAVIKSSLARGGGSDSIPVFPSEIQPYLSEPENHSFSELLLSDLLLGTAEAKNLNVVASPSELFSFMASVLFAGGAPTPTQFLERMRKPAFDIKLEESPGWLILRQGDAFDARKNKLDRPTLGKFLRSAAAKGTVSIDELAALVASTPEGSEPANIYVFLMLACPSAVEQIQGVSWEALRFHGGLSLGQRQSLEKGQKLACTQLRPDQQRLFHRVVFFDSSGMGRISRKMTPVSGDEGEGYSESLEWEPTERLPNGLNSGSTVSMKSGEGFIVQAKGTYQGHPTTSNYRPEDFASVLFGIEQPNPNFPNQFTYTEFTPFFEKKIEYSFDGDPELGFTVELKEMEPRGKAVSSPEQLPAEIWTRIKDQLAKLREAAKNRRPPPIA